MDRTQNQEPVPQHHPPPPPQKCPRCDSSNTKFCYYNNYSLSQPRYFCKGCRRYWTHGGTLRNVPIGGGCRKNKRPKFSAPSNSTIDIAIRPQPIPVIFTGMGSDMGTSSLYTSGAILSAMQGFNQPPVGTNVSLLHGMNLSSLRPFQSPQELGNGGFQLPMTPWAQGFVDMGGATNSGGGGTNS